jgi:lipopolysaccharide/colanic/teichoic acid biosynthesis glycosyltransferase
MIFKRIFDVTIVFAAFILWFPLFVLIWIALALFAGRPCFFTQMRAGKNGNAFKIIKFRTMRPGAGSDIERMFAFGKFLRKTSLDELPQLFLVLSGKMSLVGPRPLPIEYLPRYNDFQRRRHEVLPGITGWAQVNGRNCLSWDEKFKLDVWYVENRSFLLDVKILLLTVFKAISGSGVNSSSSETMSEFLG